MTMTPFPFTLRQAIPAQRAATRADAHQSPRPRRGEVGPRRAIAVLCAAMLALPEIGQDASIDWWTVDGGGEIRSEGGNWTLSGTLGQWDSTEGNVQSGGSWALTGGFWAVAAPAGDLLFKDDYER